MKKNSIFGFVGALLLGLVAVCTPYITKAQSPVLKASFVSTDSANFVAGKEVKADVKIENFSAKDATDLWYASGFLVEDGLEPYYLDVKEFKTGFAVKAKSALVLDTTYTVPTTAPKKGDVFLVALIYNGLDTVVGYAKQKITISGALETVLVDNVSLKTSNNKTFLPQEGPTLYNPAEVKEASFATGAQVVVKFSQKNPTSLTLYPQVNIVLWPENKEMFSQKLTNDKVVVNKDKSSEFVFNVPVFNYVPGVYEGKISFVDEQNKLRSEVIDFRYIVSGDMATIYNIVSDKDFGLKGEVVNLSIDIGGVPGDIQNKDSEKRTFEQHTISVNLKNEFNKVVGTKEFNVDAMETNVQLVPVTLTAPAKVLSAEVTIGAGEKILAYRQVFFGADYEKNKLEALKGGAMTWFLVIVGLLVIGLVVFFLIKKGMLKLKSTHLFILLALFSVPHFTFGATQVFNTRQDGDVGCPDPGVVVSYVGLADDQVFAPGETFTIDGTVQYKSCSNNTVNTNVEGYIIKKTDALTFPNQSKTVGAYNLNTLVSTHYHYPNGTISPSNGASFTFNYTLAQPFPNFNQMVSSSKIIESKSSVWANLAAGACASTGCWRTSTLKNLGTFTAPTTPGEYRFYFYLKHKNGCYESYYLSYIDFKVKPATPSNLTASVGGLCSPDINLTWTADTTGAVSEYRLSRSTSEYGTYTLIATLPGTTASYTDTLTSLVPGTFYYKLTAYQSSTTLESNPATTSYIYPTSCANGACKAPPHGATVSTSPEQTRDALCATGLMSEFTSNGPVSGVLSHTWKCTGTSASGAASCSTSVTTNAINGVCGTKNNITVGANYTFSAGELCSQTNAQPANPTAQGNVYTWTCGGTNGGTSATCRASVTNQAALCGTANNFSDWPGNDTGLCGFGEVSDKHFVASTNTFEWTCEVEGNSTVDCTAQKPAVLPSTPVAETQGICGSTVAGKNTINVNFSSLSGTPVATAQIRRATTLNGTYLVKADNIPTTLNGANKLSGTWADVNAAPGTTYYYKVIITNSAGSSAVSSATSGTSPAVCSSEVVGSCGEATNNPMYVTPNTNTSGMCNVGTVQNIQLNTAQTHYTWTCAAADGNASCQAPKADTNDAECGDAVNQTFDVTQGSSRGDLCNPGQASTPVIDPEDSTKYKWTCTSVDATVVRTCRANATTCVDCGGGPGGGGGGSGSLCGSKHGSSFSSIPNEDTAGLCSGASSVVSGSIGSNAGGYYWNCKSGNNPAVGCYAGNSGGVSVPNNDCNGGTCPPPTSGPVELRQFKASPSLITAGGQCSIRLDQNVFEKANFETRCTLKLPSGEDYYLNGNKTLYPVTDDGAGGPQYINELISEDVFKGSSYSLSCYQVNAVTGATESGSEKTVNALCRINPALIETSFVDKFYGGIKTMSASVFDAIYRFFNLR